MRPHEISHSALMSSMASFARTTAFDIELSWESVIAERVGETPRVLLAVPHRGELTIAERLSGLPWPRIDP